MGKKGEAMRAAKRAAKIYTFTQDELDAHDALVIHTRKERIKADMQQTADRMNAELNEAVRKEWEEREQLFSDKGLNNNLVEIIALLIAISARTLVEDFKWEPLPVDGNYRKSRKLAKFCEAVALRVMNICGDDKVDIRQYNDETYELYGVRFMAEEAD